MVAKQFVAMKAVIAHDGDVLLLQEDDYDDGANEGFYHLPGGRVEPGEAWDDSLRREVAEETGLAVELGRPFHVGEWRPVVDGERWQVIATFVACTAEGRDTSLSGEHRDAVWIDPAAIDDYPTMDPVPAVMDAYQELEA